MMQLTDDQRAKGVIAASAGNHALGLARLGKLLNIPVTIIMPHFAPLVKIKNCQLLGATVELFGDDFDTAKTEAIRRSETDGLCFIPPFDDPAIIAGQGTLAIEMLEDAPDLDAIFVPIGGGGLAAGVATVVKSCRPSCQVIGVEPAHAPGMTEAIKHGSPMAAITAPTLADGLAVSQVGQHCFDICKELVDDIVLVSESQIAQAIVRLLEHEKTVLEGAGAAALAGAMSPDYLASHGLRDANVGLILCGGNIDLSMLNRVVERAFAADGRMCRITCSIKDRPGNLAQLLGLIADAGGNVKEISHDRNFGPIDPSWDTSVLTVETRDKAHIEELHTALQQAGIHFKIG